MPNRTVPSPISAMDRALDIQLGSHRMKVRFETRLYLSAQKGHRPHKGMIRGGTDLSLFGGWKSTRLACRPGESGPAGRSFPPPGGPNLLSDEARGRSDVVEGHVV